MTTTANIELRPIMPGADGDIWDSYRRGLRYRLHVGHGDITDVQLRGLELWGIAPDPDNALELFPGDDGELLFGSEESTPESFGITDDGSVVRIPADPQADWTRVGAIVHRTYARERFPKRTGDSTGDYNTAALYGEIEREHVYPDDVADATPDIYDPRWTNEGEVFKMSADVWSSAEDGDDEHFWVFEYPEWRIDTLDLFPEQRIALWRKERRDGSVFGYIQVMCSQPTPKHPPVYRVEHADPGDLDVKPTRLIGTYYNRAWALAAAQEQADRYPVAFQLHAPDTEYLAAWNRP